MSHTSLHTCARLFVVATLTATVAACSSQSPVSPGGAASTSLDAKPSAGGLPGVYELTFWASFAGVGWQEVSSLPVLSKELLLKARVTDTSGNPATAGSVTFDYCSYGKPTDDITNPDEAPMEACEQGAAKWVPLARALRVADQHCPISLAASACTNFGVVRIPRSVGFRFRYAQQGSSIAAGTSPARNFVWVAGS